MRQKHSVSVNYYHPQNSNYKNTRSWLSIHLFPKLNIKTSLYYTKSPGTTVRKSSMLFQWCSGDRVGGLGSPFGIIPFWMCIKIKTAEACPLYRIKMPNWKVMVEKLGYSFCTCWIHGESHGPKFHYISWNINANAYAKWVWTLISVIWNIYFFIFEYRLSYTI